MARWTRTIRCAALVAATLAAACVDGGADASTDSPEATSAAEGTIEAPAETPSAPAANVAASIDDAFAPRAERAAADPAPPSNPLPDPSFAPVPRPRRPSPPVLVVDVERQRMTLEAGDRVLRDYVVSTSKVGTGGASGSLRTPLGRHRIAEKIGDGAPIGAVFRGRVRTGEVAELLTSAVDVEEDLVLTRILWLEGLEPGVNRGPGVDSKNRYIYIHGTNEEGLIGTAASHGCVRMRNADVVDLYDAVEVGTEVRIVESRR